MLILDYYLRARTYDPRLARFLSRDPLGFADGINPWLYVANCPVYVTDPSGLEYCSGFKAGGSIVVKKQLWTWTETYAEVFVRRNIPPFNFIFGDYSWDSRFVSVAVRSDFKFLTATRRVLESVLRIIGPSGFATPDRPVRPGGSGRLTIFSTFTDKTGFVLPEYQYLRNGVEGKRGLPGTACIKELVFKQRCKNCCTERGYSIYEYHTVDTISASVAGTLQIDGFGQLYCDSCGSEQGIDNAVRNGIMTDICPWTGDRSRPLRVPAGSSDYPDYAWPDNVIDWVPCRNDSQRLPASPPPLSPVYPRGRPGEYVEQDDRDWPRR
jgi:hypothetical protein